MLMKLAIGIAGWSLLPPQPEIAGALDELIYASTSAALKHAAMTIGQIDGVSMASSDLNDGRAISTMTLTGSSGSFHKSEMRVCNDGLAAVWMGAAEIGAGAANALMICAWNKLSDVVNPEAIRPLALEPTMHRALGYHPDAVLGLRQSGEIGAPTFTTAATAVQPRDTAAAVILTDAGNPLAGAYVLTGFGSSTGPYLRPGEPILAPLQRAVAAALKSAGTTGEAIGVIYVGGFSPIASPDLAAALGLPVDRIVRQDPPSADLGYAAGLVALANALNDDVAGVTLVVSGAGLGLESVNAVVLEKK